MTAPGKGNLFVGGSEEKGYERVGQGGGENDDNTVSEGVEREGGNTGGTEGVEREGGNKGGTEEGRDWGPGDKQVAQGGNGAKCGGRGP